MLSKLLIVISVVVIGFVGYTELENAGLIGRTVCDKTLEYSIGTFDQRFGISKEEFKDSILKAEKVWEYPFQKNLFAFKENANFKINLIFDERQKLTIEEGIQRNQLETLGSTYEYISSEHEAVKKIYEAKSSEYENAVREYRENVSSFNKEVDFWNRKKNATLSTVNGLQEKERELKEQFENLEILRNEVNKIAQDLNKLSATGNEIVGQYNSEVGTYRNKYGTPREFSQGDYDGSQINIYQFDDVSHLSLVLAHELGHALKVGHVENPHSIMYYLMDAQSIKNPALTDEDIKALRVKCRLD